MLTVKHQYETKCRQVENCEDAIEHLTQQLQVTQEDLSAHRVHIAQCEEIIRSLREQAAVHKNQVSVGVFIHLLIGIVEKGYQIFSPT